VKKKNGGWFKWEPAVLMAVMLGLGLWLAVGPASGPRLPLRPGAATIKVRIGDTRGVVEVTGVGDAARFRVLFPGHEPSPEMTADELQRLPFGNEVHRQVVKGGAHWILRVLNITSWANLFWVAFGLGGQLAFSGRMFIQWLVSEKRGQSVITESFWWCSLIGGMALFSYFVWRQDPIGILGQATGIVIYTRNLRLIYKQKRRAAREAGAIAV
jgi:lipid-A-disaccharide synthase-like uncharacterized protein